MAFGNRLIKINDEGGGGASFNTVTYTGNGGTQAITGVGFQPDLVWTKGRTVGYDHGIQDSVRGVNSLLYPSLSVQEAITSAATQSFDSDGFTYGSNNKGNASGINYVAWCWKAGGAAVTNTDGTITSQVSANTEAGFSIVKWTSDNTNTSTVGHGLGVAPNVIISKARNRTNDNWGIYHSSLGLTKSLMFNSNAFIESSSYWPIVNDTGFCGGVGFQNNQVWDRISYCFAEKEGFSKFGSYVGNGNVNGPTITTDFEPAFVLIKPAFPVGTGAWLIYDNKRNTSNPRDKRIFANLALQEYIDTNHAIDFNANSFQIIGTDSGANRPGDTFIYMAFANQF